MNIPRSEASRYIYIALFTYFFILTFCKLKTSLSINFVYNLVQTFRGFCQVHFLTFCCKFSMKIIFFLSVNTDKPKFVTFLVFACTTASFIAQILSTENVLKRDAILAPVAKQWIAKDIPSYGSQSNARKLLFTDLVNTKAVYCDLPCQMPWRGLGKPALYIHCFVLP